MFWHGKLKNRSRKEGTTYAYTHGSDWLLTNILHRLHIFSVHAKQLPADPGITHLKQIASL
jgi:hypothetical protein